MRAQGDAKVPVSMEPQGTRQRRWVAVAIRAIRVRRASIAAMILSCATLVGAVDSDCDIVAIGGGVDIASRADDQTVVIAAAGLRILRSTDSGLNYSDRWLDVEGSWPTVAFAGERLLLAAGRWGDPNEVFVMGSDDSGLSFEEPSVVFSSAVHRLIDPELLVLAGGDVMLFVTEIVTDGGPAAFVIRVFRSTDGGRGWWRLTDAVVGPANIKIEDPKATELANGDVLLAYEYELEDLGASRIEQVRSRDGGSSWDGATVIWDDVDGSDDEPGGYQRIRDDEVWFLASTDEDVVDGYSHAVVKRKSSLDEGASWQDKLTLVSVPDQIVFGSAATSSGHMMVATVRHFSSPPRILAVYHVDPEVPGVWGCAPLIFVDGLDGGAMERWSSVGDGQPSTAARD